MTAFFRTIPAQAYLNQGTGIGLSITKEFIKLHGGNIHVESELNKGCAFTIQIPLKRALETAMANNRLCSQNRKFQQRRETFTGDAGRQQYEQCIVVLLVEDNDDFRFYLKDNLRNKYKVIEAANGKEGGKKHCPTIRS